MTGSVDEALNLMDRLSGGNFLGGSSEKAEDIVKKARDMATTIRVTSAIAGMSPQEAYKNMQNLQQSLSTAGGMNPYISTSSGYSAMMQNMAYNATSGYNMWAAMNPNATQQEKAQAMLAANGRAQRYAGSNAAALAAAVADNRSLFSEEELKKFETSYKEGRPNDMADMIRERLGSSKYTEYLTNPAMQIGARWRVSQDKASQDLLDRIDSAGQEGNMAQAEQYGAKKLVDAAMGDLDMKMSDRKSVV